LAFYKVLGIFWVDRGIKLGQNGKKWCKVVSLHLENKEAGSVENCLVIVSEKQWQSLLSQVTEKPFIASPARETDRFLLANAFEIELDNQGRFVVPPALAKYANLNEEIVFIGLLNRVEIWGLENWQKHQTYLNQNAGDIAEQLGNVGKKKDE